MLPDACIQWFEFAFSAMAYPLTSVVSSSAVSRRLPPLTRLLDGYELSEQEALGLVEIGAEGMAELCGVAAELRDRGRGKGHHVFAQGVHTADAVVPGFLRVLHVPAIARRG